MYRRRYHWFRRGSDFSHRLQYRGLILRSLADHVRFSFIVQKSLMPLDLNLCERYFNTAHHTLTYSSMVRNVHGYMNTEEKCRMVLAPKRNLLYCLHLDLPKGRDCSLLSRPKSSFISDDPLIPHVVLIETSDCQLRLLNDFIVKALRHPGKELRILKWFVSFDEYSEIPTELANVVIKLLYKKKIHSPIVKDFFKKFNLREWMITMNENPDILEYLLYEARHNGIILEDGRDCGLADCCIISGVFSNIDPILKYNFASTYSMDICNYYLNRINFYGVDRIRSCIEIAETWMSLKRYYKMLQFLEIYSHISCTGFAPSTVEAASEAVRLLWESVTDSFLTSTEIAKVLGEKFTPDELTHMYSFYSTAVGESHLYMNPRSLKHLCRTTVRGFLWAYQHWLPDGIRELDLPEELHSYLNLEKGVKKESES